MGKAYGNATYAGSVSLFSGMTPDDMTAPLKPAMLTLPVDLPPNVRAGAPPTRDPSHTTASQPRPPLLHGQTVPEEFEVVMLFQEAAGDEDVDDPPLLAKPDFFVETAGCGGKPEPDASYVSFTLE